VPRFLDWILEQVNQWYTPTHAEHLLRIVAAVILGGLIGLERERQDKPAGFRTIILICLGACVFTILSHTAGNGMGDPGRIAAQIVTGIGFLGAGAIIHERGSVVGLTTAASVWAVAAIGMAAGFGQFGLAIIGTGMILAALILFQGFEDLVSRNRNVEEYTVAAPESPDSLDRLTAMLNQSKLRLLRRTWYQEPDKLIFLIRASGSQRNHEQFRWLVMQSNVYEIRKSRK
jgi:putative Mg2+ transporter-C (MgtC) family protein